MEIQRTTEEWERQIGQGVLRTRIIRDLTQVQLAERANVSLSAVKNLERGRGSSVATLVRVARALDRAEWLAQFSPAEPAVSPMELLRERQRGRTDGTGATGGPGARRRVRHRPVVEAPTAPPTAPTVRTQSPTDEGSP